jgi:hypothetical protein
MKKRPLLLSFLATATTVAQAKCGSVDYSWGASALATMHDYVVTMMLYSVYILGAISVIVGIYSAMLIYFKMNAGEQGVTKAILMLVGSALFFTAAIYVLPAFFGYRL